MVMEGGPSDRIMVTKSMAVRLAAVIDFRPTCVSYFHARSAAKCRDLLMMNTNLTPKTILGYTAAAAFLFASVGCDVKKTESGAMPDVKVEGGKLPKYDVDTADVSVKQKETEVTVPKITSEKKQISVPDVDITMPSEKKATPAAAPVAPPPPAAPAPPAPATPAPPQ
jgi:hypothetical protein